MKKRILDSNEIREILNINDSNKSDEEKAKLLNDLCNINDIKNTIEYNKFKEIEGKNTIKAYEIYKSFVDKGLLFEYESKYNCDFNEMKKRLDKLIIINDALLDETKSDYQKAYVFLSCYNNIKSFKESYGLFINRGLLYCKIPDERLNYASDVLLNFKNILNSIISLDEKGIIKDVKYVLKCENYNKYYNYAKFVIESYINSNTSHKKKEFLNNLGINEDIFDYCIKIIEELDLDLYNKYLAKKEENYKKIILRNQKAILNLEEGIKTGYMPNGEKFDILLFIKKVPFKNHPYFYDHIKKFILRFIPSCYDTIINYIYQNKLQDLNHIELINENDLFNTKEIVKNHIMTKEEKEIIINYLKLRRIPIIPKTYTIARNMYFNNELDYTNINTDNIEKNDKLNFTLIPKINN